MPIRPKMTKMIKMLFLQKKTIIFISNFNWAAHFRLISPIFGRCLHPESRKFVTLQPAFGHLARFPMQHHKIIVLDWFVGPQEEDP